MDRLGTQVRASFASFLGPFAGMLVVLLSSLAEGEETGSPEKAFNPFPRGSGQLSDEPELPTAPPVGRTKAQFSDEATEEAAEDGGFRWPGFPKPKLPTIPKPSLPRFSMPSWMTEREEPPASPRLSDEPSTWQKFSSGTKDLFSKTKQTLLPWNDEESAGEAGRRTPPPKRAPAKSSARAKSKPASTEKKGLFSWFSRQEEPKKNETVNDFLSRPRPK